MKNIKHFLIAVMLIGFSTAGFAQTEAQIEALVAKSKAMVQNSKIGVAKNKMANPNPSAITDLEYYGGSYDTVSRTVYVYNTNGDILQETEYMYYGSYEPASRGLYTYNSNGQPTQYLVQTWDDSTWADAMKQTLSYTSEGDMSEILIQVWTGTQWMTYFGMRLNYTYDANGNFTAIVIQQRNQLGVWVDVQKQLIDYGANNQPTTIVNQVQGAMGWEDASRMINMTWHTWGGLDQQQFTYAELEEWNGTQWVKTARLTDTYNSSNLILSELVEEWDVNTYVNSQRTTYTYDQYDNQRTYVEEEYDIAVSAWDTVYGERSQYTYNANNSIDTEITSVYDINGWEIDGKRLYEYSTVGIAKKTSQVAVKVYPNPVADMLYLEFDAQKFSAIVIDATGRNVMQVQNMKNLDVSNLNPGVYSILISSEKGNATVKFIKY